MGAATTRQLIVGIGGSGRTHRLRAWADSMERHVDGQVVWVRGSFEHRSRVNASRRLLESLERLGVSDALAVDDAHWLPDIVVERIIDLTDQLPVGVARSTWPDSAALRELDAALTVHDPAERLGPLDDHALRQMLDDLLVDDANRDVLMALTGGLSGLVRLLVDADCLPSVADDISVPPDVVDAIVRRARDSGADVLDAAHAMTLGADLATATRLVDDDLFDAHDAAATTSDLERRLRVAGLVADDRLIAVAAAAIATDMTEADRARAAARAAEAVDVLSPIDRARLIHRSGDAHQPEERAAAAVFLGVENAAESVGALSDLTTPGAASSAFILDMRAMRWDRARQRNVDGCGEDVGSNAAARRTDLAAALGGVTAPASPDPSENATVDGQVLADLLHAMHAFASGSDEQVGELATRVVDDAMAARLDIAAGWSPAAIAGALMTAAGQPDASRRLLRSAISADLGGPGEQASHHLLAAHADVACGDFSAALDLVRLGPQSEWQHRDHFLLAALDAAIARRSGDTTRLRDSWKRSAPIVGRQSLTWLLLDPTIEVLAAGARVGDAASIGRARAHLADQLQQWPADGPGRAMVAWTDLQVAVASEDWAGVTAAADRFAPLVPTDARSRARRDAASVWAVVASRLGVAHQGDATVGVGTPDGLDSVVEALVAVGDAWEASRLLGQIALDHPDPGAARSLLEQARLLVSDPVEAADGLLTAGLSEREADVARLVAEGRTYKAIGGQLFISAKTVEHHVARIRQRLGAGSRAELLAMIRELAGSA